MAKNIKAEYKYLNIKDHNPDYKQKQLKFIPLLKIKEIVATASTYHNDVLNDIFKYENDCLISKIAQFFVNISIRYEKCI
ncbi:MAG: hypothetical protein JJU28_17000 [Cyclobacteriaceae bacterium]|nr:hypothetical protein [Cyclobacteriaceae bacterium]